MKRNILFILSVVTCCEIFSQSYVHYFMSDGTYNGFYTSEYPQIKHNNEQQTTSISINGKEHAVRISDIEKIVVEDAVVSDKFNGDYRIYDITMDSKDAPFKHVIADTRASLLASKNGDFGANDTIMYSSAYNNKRTYFITGDNGLIKNMFDGQSLYYFDYNDNDETTLENILVLYKNKNSKIFPQYQELTTSPDNVFQRQYNAPLIPCNLLNQLRDWFSKASPLVDLGVDLGMEGFSYLATNYQEVSDNPELHNQLLIVDGLSLAGDIASLSMSIFAGIPTGGLAWASLVAEVGLMENDVQNLLNDMFPDSEQKQKYIEYYQNKYRLILNTEVADNIKSDSAEIRGSILSLKGINGDLYFTFSKLFEPGIGSKINGQTEQISPNSYLVKSVLSNLEPEETYFYKLWFECKIDGMNLIFTSENAAEFTTMCPSATTVKVVSVRQNDAVVKCDYRNVPYGAKCGVEYWSGDNVRSITTSANEGEQSINISGLNSSTSYKWRAFVKFKDKAYYGNIDEFTTKTDSFFNSSIDGAWKWVRDNGNIEIILLEDGTIYLSPYTDYPYHIVKNQWNYDSSGNVTISVMNQMGLWDGTIVADGIEFQGTVDDVHNPLMITGSVYEWRQTSTEGYSQSAKENFKFVRY